MGEFHIYMEGCLPLTYIVSLDQKLLSDLDPHYVI